MAIFNTQIKGGGSAPVISSLGVTPSTSAQTITATGGVDGYSPVNVSAVTSSIDANIVAGNIKNGVTILGVTGNYSGTTPSGTLPITTNGVYDVTNYASADVSVSVSGYTEIPSYVVSSGVASKRTLSLTGHEFDDITEIAYSANIGGGLRYAFAYTNFTGTANFPNLTVIGAEGLAQTFMGSKISGATFGSLVNATGQLAFNQAFAFNANFASASFPVLKVAGTDCFMNCFNSTSLTTMTFTALETIGATAFMMAFSNCTSLTTLSFPALKTVANSNSFSMMLNSCSNVTVHFPSNLQATVGAYASTLAGYNGTNTTVLFDLPATE